MATTKHTPHRSEVEKTTVDEDQPQTQIDSNTAEPVNPHLPSDAVFIFTDIETESLMALLLLQIAAVTSNNLQFNVFINPYRPLSETCTNFLGFYYYKNKLFRNGRLLFAKSIKQALFDFVNFIANIPHPVVLVYHNGFSFDCSVLARNLIRFNIPIPPNLISVCDSLPYIRNLFKSSAIENHKLGTLAKHFNIHHEQAHCALSDSIVLKQICEQICKQENISFQTLFKDSCRSFSEYTDKFLYGKPIKPLKKIKRPKGKKAEPQTTSTEATLSNKNIK